jgi:hypothetical protein
MMEAPATRTHTVNWMHMNGTRIDANILVTPGNNNSPADVDLAFDSFCTSMRVTLLVRRG